MPTENVAEPILRMYTDPQSSSAPQPSSKPQPARPSQPTRIQSARGLPISNR
ncbi:Uncharacterised protein [Rothia dentocariosa]|uniref:Uncharacterized protein n=1 Tax=Rothia dentocariosa TaxID=2047 RepID=A0A448UX21_9MICC|nr:Uncharacterised protein [Rothia dentocariosa]